MSQKLINLRKFYSKMLPRNSYVALASMATSFILAFISMLICYVQFKDGKQSYSDIIAGSITLYGVFKSIDFYIYYTFTIGFAILFLLFNIIYSKKFAGRELDIFELKPFNIFVGLLPVLLMTLFRISSVPIFYMCFIIYLIVVYSGLKRSGMQINNIVKIELSCFFVYLSSSGALAITAYYYPNLADRGVRFFIPLLWGVLLVAALIIYYIAKGKFDNYNNIIDKFLLITQLPIPLILYGLINTRFVFRGAPYTPPYYMRFKQVVLTAIALLLVINFISLLVLFIKNKRLHSVQLSTIISFVAVSFWNTTYNLIINTDQFHTGEIAIVYQQIVDFGQKWGQEFISVLQGLGFVISWINHIVFGGTFATFTQANNLYLVLVAILTVILLYQIVEHKWLALLIAPIIPIFCMDRTYLIAPVYLFLMNKKLVRNPVVWTYCYILTCIVHVWYQPSYGGAVAASLLPVLAYIWYNEFKHRTLFNLKDKESKFKFGAFLFSVVLIGLACIPLLENAIHFLRTNRYETQITNGLSIRQFISAQPAYFTGYSLLDRLIEFFIKYGAGVSAFIVMFYMLLRYVVREKDNIKKIQGLIVTMSAIISYILMLPAIFTRIDPGISRIGSVGFIYFGFLTWILLYLYRKEIRIKPLAFLTGGIALATAMYILYPMYLQIHQKVYSVVTVPDNAIYANPEENGLKNLGYAFLTNEQYFNELKVINEICEKLLKKDQTYYDLTDKSVYYLLTNKKVPGLYVSPMVSANEPLQTESIEELNNNDVPIVFINQPLNYIGVSQSLRSYRLYRYFVGKDYQFIRYKGCDFLIRSDVDLTSIKDGIEYPDIEYSIGRYDDLVDKSSYNSSLLDKMTMNNIVFTNSIDVDNYNLSIYGDDPFTVFSPNNQIDFSKIQLVEINLKNKPADNMMGQLFVHTESVTENEDNSLRFDMKSKRILIPIYKYDQFKLDTKLVSLRLDFDCVPNGTDVTVDSINLYSLSDVQKENFAQQCRMISKTIPDNRLDDVFHQPNLIYLPYEWGRNFKSMSNRFIRTDSATVDGNNVFVGHYNFTNGVSGDKGEFLRVSLDCGDFKDINAIITIKGLDKNGNELNEQFQFVVNTGDMLIPVGSSPNCLQAQKISGFDISFSSAEQISNIKISEAILYQLVR